MNTHALRSSLRTLPQLHHAHRAFSTSGVCAQEQLRIGYVPEHFATPLHFAQDRFGLSAHATLTPFPRGTGSMIEAFHRDNIDVGVGLTESWVAGMARDHARSHLPRKREWQRFHIASSYVESPLRWALTTGATRSDINGLAELQHGKAGVSRTGSGSHIMSMVLADQQKWFDPSGAPPFQICVCGPFPELRQAVNSGRADFFMWEHYTTKKYWENGELKWIGEVPTPWNGWHIAVRGSQADPRVEEVLYPALREGLQLFKNDREAAISFITANMDYARVDAEAWYDEVTYAQSLGKINGDGINAAIKSLRTAGFIQSGEVALQDLTSANA
ncbi:MAG: hypothetical protein Q9159_007567 [Coniocarpon cinnabarinum]